MSGATTQTLDRLAARHPEWRPWLELLGAARAEMANPAYAAAVADPPAAAVDAPLVDGVTLVLDPRVVDGWVRRALLAAGTGDGPAATLAAAARAPDLDGLAVLESAIAGDGDRLDTIARRVGAEGAALASLAAVLTMPLLQAFARRWESLAAPAWDRGYCPVCGAWPALAEARGLERQRRLRCARCGGDWLTEWLRCPYCGVRDHVRLGALVPEDAGDTRKVETCLGCRRYVKTLTTLGPTPPDEVAIQDLATVELDLAALASGFAAAPPGLGRPVAVRVTARDRRPRLARWR